MLDGVVFGDQVVELMLGEEADFQVRRERTDPPVGGRRPEISLAKVDLPLPFEPSSAMRSSVSMRRLTLVAERLARSYSRRCRFHRDDRRGGFAFRDQGT
jgi:hypothetical protein